MNKSFLNYIDNRKGERLVQGILLFLLQNDIEFKQAFCKWVGWEEFIRTEEECPFGVHRHDIVFFYKDTHKSIELKFWADWTESQSNSPNTIDLVIVPKVRLEEARDIFTSSITKTWEELEEKVIYSSDVAKVLLSGLDQYYWLSDTFENNDELEKVLSVVLEELEFEGNFFRNFASKINQDNLSVGKLSSSLSGFKGFFIKNSNLKEDWINNLWFGIEINAGRWKKEQALEYCLVLQVCSEDNATKFNNLEILPDFIYYAGHNEGVIIDPNTEGKYTIESTWNQCKELINQYSLMMPTIK